MKNKLLKLIGFFVAISLIGSFSCRKCGPFPDKYRVIDAEIEMVSISFDTLNANRLVVTELGSDSIYYNDFGLVLEPVIETYFSFYQKINSFGFINQAYACSPGTPSPVNQLLNIEIYTNKSYDTTHPKGSNLAEYFDVYVADEKGSSEGQKLDLKEYLKTKPFVSYRLVLDLKTPPDHVEDFVFTLVYSQSGSSIKSLTLHTDTVTILY